MDNIEIEHSHQHKVLMDSSRKTQGFVFLCTHHALLTCQVFAHASARTPTLPTFHLGDYSRVS